MALSAVFLAGSGRPASAQGTGTPPPPERPAQDPPDHQTHDVPPASEVFVRAFGSVNWGKTTETGVPNSFALGQFALFATATLGERFSVLAEVVLEGSRTTEVTTDLERLQVTYRLNDSLQVTGGRYHSSIGYYNTAFHHGAFFETTTGRPLVFEFEDEGGVLPVHEVGLSAGGAVPGTGGTLHYVAEVGNGRFWGSDEGGIEAETPDTNDAKSTNVALAFKPGRWRGLEIGASYYRDKIPVDPDPSPLTHRIASAYFVYRTPSVEVMAEWLQLTHITPDGARFRNHAGYVQLSKAWGRLRPYYRYDSQQVDPATPLIGVAGDYDANIVGLRYDPGPAIGLKAQYERTNLSKQRGIDTLRTQLVFVF